MGCGNSADYVKKKFDDMKKLINSGYAKVKEKYLQLQAERKMKEINEKLAKNKDIKLKTCKLSDDEQERLQQLIEGGNTIEIMKIIKEKDINAHEDIGTDGYKWNIFHFACQNNKQNLVHVLLFDSYRKDKEFYTKLINSQTFEEYTPAMICCMFDSQSALNLLLQAGGSNLQLVSNGTMSTAKQMAKSYKAEKCLGLLKHVKQENFPVNDDFFSGDAPKETSQEQSQQDQEAKRIKEENEKKKRFQLDLNKEKEERQKQLKEEQEQLRKQREAEQADLRRKREEYEREVEQLRKERERLERENAEKIAQQRQEMEQLEQKAKQSKDEQEQQEALARKEEMMKAQQDAEERQRIAREEAQKLSQQKKAQIQKEEKQKLEQRSAEDANRQIEKLKKFQENSLFSQYLEQVKAVDGVYIDKEFPHTCKSITGKDSYPENPNFDKALWLRPSEILKCDYSVIQLYENGIDPNDIQQGGLGVCYFLCILSALAEYPDRVKKLFVNNESNKYGIYSIVMYPDGKRREIIIDDFIPCDRNSKRPIFSRVNGKELWAVLMEKAWGKTFKNFIQSEAGSPHIAMEELTGCPSDFFNLDEFPQDELFNNILDWDKRKYLFGLSSRTDRDQESKGIVGGHAYTLIGAYKIGNTKLLKCRNPWGNHEWKGQFGDDGTAWTDDLKKQVNFVSADDGIFFVDLDEFYEAFDSMSIGYLRDDYNFTSISIVLPHKQQKYYEFNLEADGEVNIRLHQKYEKRLDYANFEYSRGDFDLYKIEDNGDVKLVCNGNGWNSQTVNLCEHKAPVFLDLKKGKYVIKILWNLWEEGKNIESTQYNLSTYCKQVTPIVEMAALNIQKFQKSQILSQANTYARTPAQNSPSIKEGKGWDDACNFFFVFENTGTSTVQVSVDLLKSKGLAFPGGVSKYEMDVEPGSLEFVVAQNQNKGAGGQVSLSYVIRYG